MDLSQATQMLRWLDDEHRKNKIVLGELQQQIVAQKELIISQARRLEELEARIAATQASLYRFDQVETNLQQTRAEASALLPKFEHTLHESLDTTAQARAVERERDSRMIHE